MAPGDDEIKDINNSPKKEEPASADFPSMDDLVTPEQNINIEQPHAE